MKYFIILIALSVLSINENLKPVDKIHTSGDISDFLYRNDYLYIATMQGKIEIYQFSTRKKIRTITFDKITDFEGNSIYPRLYSVDKSSDNDNLVVVVQAENGFQDVYLLQNKKKIKIVDAIKDHLMIKRAKFFNKDEILLGLFSNEMVLWNVETKQQIYKHQISISPLSDFILDNTHKLCITCDESGSIYLINTELGKIIKKYSGIIKDRVFSVDYKNLTFLAGGKDRQLAVYFLDNREPFSMKSSFFVTSVALSPSAKTGAYVANENGDVNIFNISTKEIIHTLKESNENTDNIFFIDENTVLTSASNKYLKIWKLN